MSEYAISVFAVCLVGGIALMLTYGGGTSEKIAVGLITLSVIITPLADCLSDFNIEEWLNSIKAEVGDVGTEYGEVLEEAFAEGIVRAVADKFSLDKENIRVSLTGFDAERLWAQRIRITLSGRAALADYKAVENYVNTLEMGKCDVEIEIGQ